MKFVKAVVTLVAFVAAVAAQTPAMRDPCAPDCSIAYDGQLFPHPQNCEQWYQCNNIFVFIHECPANLYFNPTLEVCDFPETAGCLADPNFICEVTTTETPMNSTTENPVEPTTTEEPVEPSTTVVATTAETTVITTEDLSTFEPTTAAPTTEEPTTAEPTTAEPTTAEPTTAEPTTAEPTTAEPTTAEPTTAEPTTAEPTTEQPTTVAPTTTEDPITNGTTSNPETTTNVVGTTEGQCIPACPSPEALYPDPHDCTMYFHCGENVPYHKSCPSGQEYWAEKERCDWPEYAQCVADPDAPCVAITNQPSQTTPSGVTTSGPGGECMPECPSPDSIFPYPQDCSKFVMCANDYPYIYDCPSGQQYWAAMERCDWPENAECDFDADSPCISITNAPKF